MFRALVYVSYFLVFGCSQKKEDFFFKTLDSNSTGIDFKNQISNTPKLNILNYLYFYNGGGVCAGDFNNDGFVDIYFTSNQQADKLYLNQGHLKFKDITAISGIDNSDGWTNGVTSVDINNDGLLDIYISKTSNYLNIKGKNLLFVNKGNIDGFPSFKEESQMYGLDISGFSTQAVFFDYDLDGDLDMFLLNHSVHPNRTYGNGKIRESIDAQSGDRLFENREGTFVDVSAESKIFQGKIGYGLGLSVGDLNDDNYPDLYIGNDFFENDYLYINQKNGSFKDIISSQSDKIGHTTHYSMGNAISDLNNDGLSDILSLDMLPEDLITYRTSGQEYPYQIYNQYLSNGYSPQYMQNTLQLNMGNEAFSEVAFLSGIAATEWSWSPLIADFDNDGNKDLYITNGILGATNDMDFINFISNDKIQKHLDKGVREADMAFIKEIPQKKTINYFYRNNGNLTFENVTKQWVKSIPSFSNGAVYADLDNDGDLDIVVNNVNDNAFVLENTIQNKLPSSYLKISFIGSEKNLFGIGAKVKLFVKGQIQIQENYTTNGYLSAKEPKLYFGLGTTTLIDSLEVYWPQGSVQKLKNVKSNQELVINIKDTTTFNSSNPIKNPFLKKESDLIPFKHKEQNAFDYNINPLIPYAKSNEGPSISVIDINKDGLEDVFIGGGKGQQSGLFFQTKDGRFQIAPKDIFEDNHTINENTSSAFFDANNDGLQDLIVVNGGNEFENGKPLTPILYINNEGRLIEDAVQFKSIETNASKVTVVDFNNDGNLDICITSNVVPKHFGALPKQYLFLNDGLGNFKDITRSFSIDFQTIGNVEDIVWVDLNNDQFMDAIVVGYWMPITIFINQKGRKLIREKRDELSKTNGFWNTVKVEDFDNDGDMDLMVGNWGLNTRLTASKEHPISLYLNDFDDNGSPETIITYYYQGKETLFANKDELVKKLPYLNKNFLSYKAFAEAKLTDLIPKEKLKHARKTQVFELASCYFENTNGTFKKRNLPLLTQISTVNDIMVDDVNQDGFLDLILVGNNIHINTQLGRLDASYGQLLLNNKNGFFYMENPNLEISGQSEHIAKVKIKNKNYYIISRNNDTPIFLSKNM